jgi:hypothetical protein
VRATKKDYRMTIATEDMEQQRVPTGRPNTITTFELDIDKFDGSNGASKVADHSVVLILIHPSNSSDLLIPVESSLAVAGTGMSFRVVATNDDDGDGGDVDVALLMVLVSDSLSLLLLSRLLTDDDSSRSWSADPLSIGIDESSGGVRWCYDWTACIR